MPISIKTKVRFNGQEYDSMEAMPAEVRQAYEQIMANLQNPAGKVVIHTSSKIVFNGQEYAGVEAMPEEIRRRYQQIMSMVAKDGNGVPDLLEGGTLSPAPPVSDGNTFAGSSPLLMVEPLPGTRNGSIQKTVLTVVIGLIILVVLLAGVATVYFLVQAFGK